MARYSRWGGRSRRASKADAAAIAAVVVAIVFVVTAGVSLIIAIGRALAAAHERRRLARSAAADAPAAGSEDVSRGGPEPRPLFAQAEVQATRTEAYHSAIDVDPRLLDEPGALEHQASAVFAAWASRLPRAPRDPSDLVIGYDVRHRLVGRLTTTFEGRRFVWRTKSGFAPGLPPRPAFDVARLDPWEPPIDLRAGTLHAVACKACAGAGRRDCGRCGGSSTVTCPGCHGARKYHQHASNGSLRLMNCKACKAKGYLACGCVHGHVPCAACSGSGKLTAWLEVDEAKRIDVQVEPDGDITRAFWWGSDGTQASDADIDKDARVLCAVDATSIASGDLPPEVPSEWRESHWQALQPRAQSGERPVAQRFTLLELPAVDVRYAVGSRTDCITLEGRRLLAPPASVDRAFAARATLLRVASVGLVALPVALGISYLVRGSWFMNVQVAAVMGLCAVAAALTYVALWQATLARRTAWASLAAIGLCLGGGLVMALDAEPDLERVRAQLAQGDRPAARVELGALGDANSDPELAHTRRVIDLAEVENAKDMAVAAEVARTIDSGSDERRAADSHVDGMQLAAARSAFEQHDVERAWTLLQAMRPEARESEDVQGLLTDVQSLRDHALVERCRADLAAGHVDNASMALTNASDDVRASAEGRLLKAQIALAQARKALALQDWEAALAAAQQALELGLREDADGVKAEVLRDSEASARAFVAKTRESTDAEARVRSIDAALRAWQRYASLSGAATTPEIAKLEAQRVTARDALAKQRAAEAAKREAEAKRQAAAQAAEQRRAAARAAAEERSYRVYSGKVCNKGCPCGNSCISCSKTCHH